MNLASRYRNLTEPLQTERRVELVLLVLVLLLVLQVLWGLYRAIVPSVPDPVRPTSEALATRDLVAMQAVPADARAGIRQRPLFWVTRRPVNAVEQPAAETTASASKDAKPQKIEGLKLAGVFGAGDSAGIIVLAKDKKHRVTVGQEIKGWTLQSVGSTEALFSSNGREAKLALKRGKIEFAEVPPEELPAAEGSKAEASDAPPAAQAEATPRKQAPPGNKRKPAPAAGGDSLSLGGGDRGAR
ncbi:hypothetical protein F0M18_03645 [Pseudohalioglobus sediminis]|uniref:Type II secretion system protein GspC N-terminal domain-containing protein n=1 Tax=Pseudohalioglobus sediminis TaxID=2606449 RepID=A0A5B0X843_9GAMM|nr:hypothetical protein [Pseudohalioglobus sediminis]KAA1194531.1 hypothetical protein F0M18_03645 [Pseudohalioglobus sediminis]